MSGTDIKQVEKGRQVSVFLQNRPGALAGMLAALAAGGNNVMALSVAEGLDHGYVRLVCDDHAAGVRALRDADHLVLERDVLLLELSNAPGALARIMRRLGDAGVNVEYAYCASGPTADSGLIVVRVEDGAAALEALKT